MNPFSPRPIRFHGIREHAGWRIKIYSIVLQPQIFEDSDFDAALERALTELPQPAVTPARPGLAFVILHRGHGADYAVIAWWDRENELPVRVFVRSHQEQSWRPAASDESFCVWDLQVIGFERDAYVATVLAEPAGSLAEYLRRVLTQPPSSAQLHPPSA